ncbi:MAG: hypothetical protein BWY76_00788 [bacterium ADurb.Bin429]|nr:MAG: hypothetical protein BWY76_00788 [bacterium ADurb.Bin429]
MSSVTEIARDARETALKSVTPETWSLKKENALLNGVAVVYRTLKPLPGDTPEDLALRALQMSLRQNPARKRMLVVLLDRIRQRQGLPRDAQALPIILAQILTRVEDARTTPRGLADRVRRFMAKI